MTLPMQFASLYDGQEVFVWSDSLLDLGTDFLVGNMVFVQRIRLKIAPKSVACFWTFLAV